jgi:hypothetical protein
LQLCELFDKSKATISEHIKHVFEEGELIEDSVVRNFRTTAQDGKELLTHAGKISHQMALEKSSDELKKYKETQRQIEKENSLKEIEQDIKSLSKNIKKG